MNIFFHEDDYTRKRFEMQIWLKKPTILYIFSHVWPRIARDAMVVSETFVIMMKYTIVETAVPRESTFPERAVYLPIQHFSPPPPFGNHEALTAWMAHKDNAWAVNYNVRLTLKEKALRLAAALEKALIQDVGSKETRDIIRELKLIRAKDAVNLTPLELWQRIAYQLPDDIGGGHIIKRKNAQYLTKRYSGRILEAMCGFNSYLLPKDGVEVVALDYCQEALERYPYPTRKRICCDLNELSRNTRIPCFKQGEFDTVSVCFGYRYPEDIVRVMRELKRILKPNGVLSFIENPAAGYSRICRREFAPVECEIALAQAGFRMIRTHMLKWRAYPETHTLQNHCYFHIEALNSTAY